jgi:hypothetical protein
MRRDKDCPHLGSMAVIGELVLAQEAADRAADAAGLPRPPRPPQRPPRTRQEAEHIAESAFHAAEYEYRTGHYEAAEQEAKRIWRAAGLGEYQWHEARIEIRAAQLNRPQVAGWDVGECSGLIILAREAARAWAAGSETWEAWLDHHWPHGRPRVQLTEWDHLHPALPVPQS